MGQLPILANSGAPGRGCMDAVRGLVNSVEGEVRLDLHNRLLYATDASVYQAEPLGVFLPASVDDAVAGVRYCAGAGIPMLPRGGGTSLAGQCTNRAVVFDFSPNCRALLGVDVEAHTCRVEPGLTVDDLNDQLAAMGGGAGELFFAPDPATSRHANIGGCIGNNAAGARSVRYGRTSESVVGIDVCLADGRRVELREGSKDPVARALAAEVVGVVRRHERLIRERFPRTIRRNAGYGLDMILAQLDRGVTGPEGVNLAPLLCGSEGTLALTLGAELLLHPRPRAKGLAVLGFGTVEEAIERVVPILGTRPTAVELLDDTVIDLARANAEYRRYVDLLPAPKGSPVRAVLYVEYFGASREEVAGAFESLRRTLPGCPAQFHTDAGAMGSAWKLRKAGEPLLHGVVGKRKPITFVEDNAIPVERLGEFVRELKNIVASHGTFAAFYAHASVGVLHVRPLVDIHDGGDRAIMRDIAVRTADLARSLGGVMSGEHGDGRVRGPLLERYFGPELMGAFREVKRIFDPRNLLNPGDIVDLDGRNPRPVGSITEHLRVEPEPGRPVGVAPGVRTYFDYSEAHGFDAAVELCNGAGVCRKKQGGTMCPSYMATLDERHSTRGRGNALRLAITGQSAGDGHSPAWTDPATIETLDLCLSCKACKTECPSNVDIAKLKAEYTAQRWREQGVPLKARVFGAIRTLNRLGSMAPGLANAVNRWGPVRRLMGRVLGLHPARSIPELGVPLSRAWGGEGTRGNDPRVVLFGDCFTMYNEPGVGLAARRLLEACGYRVELADAGCCGRAKISMGMLAAAAEEIDATLAHLVTLAKDPGVVAILVAEPSCLSAIKDDWLSLHLRTSLADRRLVAGKAALPEQFVDARWDQHPRRPRFREGPEVLLHGHCHQKALWGAETSAGLLRRIAGDRLRVLDTGCCGMAGSFGYDKNKHELSMKIAGLSLVPSLGQHPGATICAPGTSCRHQVRDATGRRSVHPVEFAASLLIGEPEAPHA